MKSLKVIIAEKCIKFLQLQLFISLLSFPILGIWGLPLSMMSVVGNLFFTPWVILFVAVSTLIFFTELAMVPNEWLIYILEYITEAWYYCLSWGKKSWVMGIPDVMIPYTFVLSLFAFIGVCHKRWGQLIESTLLLIMLYGSFFAIWYWTVPVPIVTSLQKNKGELCLVSGNNKVVLYDHIYLQKVRSTDSWVEYTLIPFLIKNIGTIKIDTIVIDEFLPRIIPLLVNIMEHAEVKIIKIPYFSEELTRDEWCEFFKLYEIAKKEGTTIRRIYQKHL